MFSAPKKTADGRYYAKPTERVMMQVNNVRISGKFSESDTVTMEIADCTKISEVDSSVIQAAKENSELWFGKVLPDKTLEAAYTGSVVNGVMNVDKVFHKGECLCRTFAADKTFMDPELIEDGTLCDVYMEFAGLYFMKKTYSPVWKLVQVKVRPGAKKKYTDECLFQDDEVEESDEEL